MISTLTYSLLTAKSTELEKVSLIDMQKLVNTLAVDEKYLVLHRENLTTPIQMQLYQKQNAFSQFFDAFLKSSLNFKHLE